MSEEITEKYRLARESLPNELWKVFDELVAEYRYRATLRHGAPYVAYMILADLIRAGWRRSAEAIEE